MKQLALLLAVGIAPHMSFAQEGPLHPQERVETCLATQAEKGQPSIACINEAQGTCIQYIADAPQAALHCFLESQKAWSDYIGARMEWVAKEGGDDIAAVAGIEVKFDLLQNKLQCQRMSELAMLRTAVTEQTQIQAARCDATANGLVFAKLFIQSQSLNK